MGLATTLLIGGLVGGYLLGQRGKGDKEQKAPDPVIPPEQTAAEKVEATNPVSAPKAESANVAEATTAATRTRRRAAAGNSGRVTTGSGATNQGAGGSQKSLIGY
jgi:hypothetical protein